MPSLINGNISDTESGRAMKATLKGIMDLSKMDLIYGPS